MLSENCSKSLAAQRWPSSDTRQPRSCGCSAAGCTTSRTPPRPRATPRPCSKAAREIRANLEAAARLDGLNAPQRSEVSVSVDATPALAAAEWLRQVTAVAGGGQPAALPSGRPVMYAEVVDR